MKKLMTAWFLVLSAVPAFASNYLLNGGQESIINYKMVQKVQPSAGIRMLILNYVVPKTFSSPTYNQKIENLDYTFTPKPMERKDTMDGRGNKVIEVIWQAPLKPITSILSFTATNSVKLQSLKSNVPFPLDELPKDVIIYLDATDQVAGNDPGIRAKAKELTGSSETEFDAVQKILTWVVDHMHYVLIPQSYDSTYSFKTGKGNCQNYSHLSAALMRAVGIPVRIVNGITLKEPYDISMGRSIMTMKLAQGRHSWIEIYFPDLGWIPTDAQGTQLFVSNRFVRVEVGVDNNETEQDGLIQWSRLKGSSGAPRLSESIDANFKTDNIKIEGEEMTYGPRELLLGPRIEAAFTEVSMAPPPPPPPIIQEKELKRLDYREPYLFGNIEFPENADFLSTRGPVEEDPDGTMKVKKNFLVETAEYVTTKGQQYAQIFVLNKPLSLSKIGLALHKFSDEGQLWLELYKDDNGMPGDYVTTSNIITLSGIGFQSGYSWMDFDFHDPPVKLSPGRYWIALGFTGSPIVNWFYSYGKPVGPVDGTRYRKMFDETWSRSLSFEFNYRVTGLIPPHR